MEGMVDVLVERVRAVRLKIPFWRRAARMCLPTWPPAWVGGRRRRRLLIGLGGEGGWRFIWRIGDGERIGG